MISLFKIRSFGSKLFGFEIERWDKGIGVRREFWVGEGDDGLGGNDIGGRRFGEGRDGFLGKRRLFSGGCWGEWEGWEGFMEVWRDVVWSF